MATRLALALLICFIFLKLFYLDLSLYHMFKMDLKVWLFGLSSLLVKVCICCGETNDFLQFGRTSYSSAELHALRGQPIHNDMCLFNYSDIPKEIRRRKRGKSGGVKRRIRRQKCKPYLPSFIIGNVQSVSNKIDELCANVKYLQECRNASILYTVLY